MPTIADSEPLVSAERAGGANALLVPSAPFRAFEGSSNVGRSLPYSAFSSVRILRHSARPRARNRFTDPPPERRAGRRISPLAPETTRQSYSRDTRYGAQEAPVSSTITSPFGAPYVHRQRTM